MATIKLQGIREKKENCYYIFDDDKNILGEGGMGVVYLGKRIAANGTETKVAIKEVKMKDPEIIERARREASIQLNNDNLIRMYGMIETETHNELRDKNYYVISEYLEGVMLDSVIDGNLKNKNGEVYPYIKEFYESYTDDRNRTATHIVKCVLSAIMALHDAGFIHRDIDPTNIMVTSDGKIKLIDFGIAKKIENMKKTKSELTTPGQFIGKAEYAAPELILGDTNNQNFYTDIYAVGILYYQLVVGHIPFEGSKYDVIESQLHKKVPVKDITSWQIREIIRKATEKKQADRYSSAALFRAAIDNIIDPEPRRINYKLVGGIVAAVLLVALILFVPNGNSKNEPEQEVAKTDTVKVDYFKMYQNELNYANEDSVKKGFEGMKKLAEEGNVDAMFEVASTYAYTIDDSDLNLEVKKKALGLKAGLSSESQNQEAVKWLKKVVEATDSTNHKALYLLSIYYWEGKGGVAKNESTFVKLCKKCKEMAAKNNDNTYVGKADNVLNQYNKIKNQ